MGIVLLKPNAIWKAGSREPTAGPVHVSMNDYLIHRLRDIPRVALEGFRLRSTWPETEAALHNLVQAAKQLRKELVPATE